MERRCSPPFAAPCGDEEPAPRAETPCPTVPTAGGRRILLAEDNDINRMLFVEMLKTRGHSVVPAHNGAEAVELWRTTPCDLILMDVQMPVLDGVAAVAAIRAEESASGRHVPIIALTANLLTTDRHSLCACGFDGYVTKPMKLDELFAEIHRCLEGR